MNHSQHKRRFVAALLLVVYGTAGILGYGLHALWHHHHEPLAASSGSKCQAKPASSSSHCCCCHHPAPPEDGPPQDGPPQDGPPQDLDKTVQQVEEDCSICAFLAQAQTPVFRFTTLQTVAPVSNEVLICEVIAPLFIPADHLARGPPLC